MQVARIVAKIWDFRWILNRKFGILAAFDRLLHQWKIAQSAKPPFDSGTWIGDEDFDAERVGTRADFGTAGRHVRIGAVGQMKMGQGRLQDMKSHDRNIMNSCKISRESGLS